MIWALLAFLGIPIWFLAILLIAMALSTFAIGSGGRVLLAVTERKGMLLALCAAAAISAFTIIDAAGARLAENVFTFMAWPRPPSTASPRSSRARAVT